jgi:hypothetical protein
MALRIVLGVPRSPARYRSPDEDSTRWLGLVHRPGDIVISTRSKSGTTWAQMICALLVFQTAELPQPLWKLSPWVDWVGTPFDVLGEELATQRHRRILKTHTPLDGLPLRGDVHYVVVARHPLDMAVSLYHQGDNINRTVVAELTGQAPRDPAMPASRLGLRDWMLAWMESTAPPLERLDALPGVLWHFADAWRRRDEPNVTLVHYHDLSVGLADEMRRMADRLDIAVPEASWPDLVSAATFAEMKGRAREVAPDPGGHGVLKDPAAFFRGGKSGEGRQVLTPDEIAGYHARATALAPGDLLTWLHRP